MKETFEMPLCRTYELLQDQMRQARLSGKVEIKVCFHASYSVASCCKELYANSSLTCIVHLHGWWIR
jgi:hypothetical protein